MHPHGQTLRLLRAASSRAKNRNLKNASDTSHATRRTRLCGVSHKVVRHETMAPATRRTGCYDTSQTETHRRLTLTSRFPPAFQSMPTTVMHIADPKARQVYVQQRHCQLKDNVGLHSYDGRHKKGEPCDSPFSVKFFQMRHFLILGSSKPKPFFLSMAFR